MFASPRAVCIFVGDLGIARAWYSQALELEASYCDEEVVTFYVGGCQLSLRLGPAANGTGPLVYWSVDDLEGEFSRLCAMTGEAAVAPVVQFVDQGRTTAQVPDPFGNLLGLMAGDTKGERKLRNQRLAQKVALQNVRETLDVLEQSDSEQKKLNRIVGWVVGVVVVVLALALWSMTGQRAPAPSLQWAPTAKLDSH